MSFNRPFYMKPLLALPLEVSIETVRIVCWDMFDGDVGFGGNSTASVEAGLVIN
jgi:hypothetical protein